MAVLIFFCTACRKPAVIYDSSERDTDISRTVSDGEEEQVTEAEAQQVCVYVCGEVKQPGVYELPANARIADAVEAAGGMTGEAAEGWLNLAEHVEDGQKIEVPSAQEARELEEAALEQQSTLINLNTASAEQLMTLTGIGEAKAKDILEYRETHGRFTGIEELMEIPGIKEGVFQKIKDQITV
jgi:competence protein ComEA